MKGRYIAPLACSIAWLASAAQAQPTSQERAIAEGLFDEGRELMMRDRYPEACPKLEQSQRIDPGGGTLLNLALCHERLGLTATAWTEFREALAQARRDGRADREQIALEHAEKLEQQLPRLTLTVLEPSSELELIVDGVVLGREARAAPIPLNPGQHAVEARAPGKLSFTASLTIAAGETRALEIPPLRTPPSATSVRPSARLGALREAQPADDADDSKASGSQRTVGYAVGGLGIVALAVGGLFGLDALSEDRRSDELCAQTDCSSSAGVRHSENAQTSALIANIGIAVGTLALGSGAYLVLSSHADSPPTSQGQTSGARTFSAALHAAW